MGLDYKSWKQIKLEAKQDEIPPIDTPVKSTLKDYCRVSKLLALDYLAMKIAKYIFIFIACVFIYCLAVSIFN